jgi:hypothetical protein
MPDYNISKRSAGYIRDRVQSLMTSRVTIYDHGENVMGNDGVVTYTMRDARYNGKARIWESDTGATLVEGEAAITLTQTNISIPWGSYQPKKDDVVKFSHCPAYPSYVGRAFRVIAVDLDGGVHRMTVTSYADSAVWES